MQRSRLAVVSCSGGKDSTATALLALDSGLECRFVFADTGNEHDLTYEYIREYLPGVLGQKVHELRADFAKDIERKRSYIRDKWPGKGVPADVCERALSVLHATGNPFLDLCMMKGRFPSRMAQFCTQELKRYPLDAYMLELAVDHEVESWQGVRRDESARRANLADRERVAEGWEIVRPIAAWNVERVVAFVVERGVKLNPLYLMGMGRVGCMPCINCAKGELAEIATRFPEHIDRIRKWEALVGDASRRGLSTFFSGRGDGESLTDQEYRDLNSIDEKVRWSKTAHGGRQGLLSFQEEPRCASVYGLCE